MKKLFILLAWIVLLGGFHGYTLDENFTQNITENQTTNETVNETIIAVGGGTVNVLSMDWASAIGQIVSDGVNTMLGQHLLDAGIGVALISIIFIILFYTKVMNIWQAFGSIFGAIILLACLYVAAHAMGLI